LRRKGQAVATRASENARAVWRRRAGDQLSKEKVKSLVGPAGLFPAARPSSLTRSGARHGRFAADGGDICASKDSAVSPATSVRSAFVMANLPLAGRGPRPVWTTKNRYYCENVNPRVYRRSTDARLPTGGDRGVERRVLDRG
jgi:hypothetical protein